MAGAQQLHPAARAWHRAAARERETRAARDEAIREELSTGRGVREVARAFGIDPSRVVAIRRQG